MNILNFCCAFVEDLLALRLEIDQGLETEKAIVEGHLGVRMVLATKAVLLRDFSLHLEYTIILLIDKIVVYHVYNCF